VQRLTPGKSAERALIPPPQGRSSSESSVLRGLRILVVEDDPASAKLLSIILAIEGAEVKTGCNAEEAFAIVDAFKPQLIVLELALPFMSGLLFAQRLKADPLTREIVIIAVTAFNGPETERVTRSAGCAAYIKKPIDVLSFAEFVSTHVGGRS
jgi:two-component system, cell cycle response regulator DivK